MLMFGCLIADYVLVFYLVAFRDALGEINSAMHWTLMLHIPFALTTLIFYALTAYTGYRLWKGEHKLRFRLRLYDRILIFARIFTFFTSVMVQFF